MLATESQAGTLSAQAPRDSSPSRIRSFSWLLTIAAIYGVHVLFSKFFILEFFPNAPFVRPFSGLPLYLFNSWDSGWYRHLFEKYDVYVWPPLYPLTLRAINFLFRFHDWGFEKSALILNFLSHCAIAWGVVLYMKKKDLPAVSAWAVTFLLIFYPGYNVFFAAYSESYFLAVIIFVFVLRQRNYLLAAGLLAGFSALIRNVGTFLCLALAAEQLFLFLRDKYRKEGAHGWKQVAAASSGLLVVAVWNLAVYKMSGASLPSALDPWLRDLVASHVPAGESPRLWVIKYLMLPEHRQAIYFWLSIVAAGYCVWKRWTLEALFILMFSFSIFAQTYRPFSWPRFVSVLFPWAVMAADLFKARGRLYFAACACFVFLAYWFQGMLFTGRLGEP